MNLLSCNFIHLMSLFGLAAFAFKFELHFLVVVRFTLLIINAIHFKFFSSCLDIWLLDCFGLSKRRIEFKLHVFFVLNLPTLLSSHEDHPRVPDADNLLLDLLFIFYHIHFLILSLNHT
jgi:hypothetical protein